MAGDKGDKPKDSTPAELPAGHDALAQQAFKGPDAAKLASSSSTLDYIHDKAQAIAATTERYADNTGRALAVTGKALFSTDTIYGIGHAIDYDAHHLGETAMMIVDSAALGAGMKVIMSSKGPVGAVGGLLVGGYFLKQALAPVGEAYGEALNAKNDKELDDAAKKLGDAYGTFGVNSAVGWAGYKVGAGGTGRVLEGEKFDAFAEAKESVWSKINHPIDYAKTLAGKPVDELGVSAAMERGAPLSSMVKYEGDKAHLMYTAKSAPKAPVVGEVDPNAKVSITLLAKTKGSAVVMDRTINRIARRGQTPLTTEQITERFGTDDASAKAIDKFIADNNLTLKDTNHASGRYFVEGTAESMKKAFGVNWQQYEQDGVQFRGRSGTLAVSPDLAPHIKGVLGLDDRPTYHTNYVKLADVAGKLGQPGQEGTKAGGVAGDASPGSAAMDAIAKSRPQGAAGRVPATADGGTESSNVVPEKPTKPGAPTKGDGSPTLMEARPMDVNENFKAYNEPMENGKPKYTGKGMVTGFLSLGGTMPEGWNDFMVNNKIDPNTFSERNVGDVDPQPDPQGANGENGLDGVIHKVALPDAETVMVKAANNDSGMPDGIDRMTFPQKGESQITHGSISWGQYEDGWTTQSRAAMEDAGKRAALKGITITVAAGDNGAGDNSPSKKQQVDIPAGLEYFTAVGGTLLRTLSDGSYGSEKVWSGMGATGGGRSMFTLRPVWQQFLKLPKNLNGSSFDGRAEPDIAANSDPRSGWRTPTDDGIQPIGGTSAGAPAENVALAKVSQAIGKPTGYMNPKLYDFGRTNPEVFHDVTDGNNTDAGIKGYPAQPGYDLNTGWGSIDIGNMIEAYGKAANQHPMITAMKEVPTYLRYSQQTQVPAWLLPTGLQNQKEADQQQKAAAGK